MDIPGSFSAVVLPFPFEPFLFSSELLLFRESCDWLPWEAFLVDSFRFKIWVRLPELPPWQCKPSESPCVAKLSVCYLADKIVVLLVT